MTILSLDDLNNSVDEVYGRKRKSSEDIIAPKKSALSKYNPNQPMVEVEPEVIPEILHPTDLHKAVLDVYSNAPITETPTKASFMSQLGRGLASLADVAYEPVPSTLGAVTQAVARPFTTPKRAEELGGQVASSLNQPFGKAFGVTETPEYKQETSRVLSNLIAKYGNIGAEKLASISGLPIEDVRNMLGTAMTGVAPETAKAISREASMIGGAIKEKMPSVRIEMQKQLEQKQTPFAAQSIGAAQVDNPTLRLQRAQELPIPIDLSKDQITRNPADVRFARETAKNPVLGQPLQEHYAKQNDLIQKNLDYLVNETGAELTGVNPSELSKKLVDTITPVKKNKKTDINTAYTRARENGEMNEPIDIQPIKNYVANNQAEAINAPVIKSLELKINNLAKEGKEIPLNDLEEVRKMVTNLSQDSPTNAHYAKQINNLIDQLTENKGGDLYKKARKLNAEYMTEFEDTPIIKNITALKKGTTQRAIALEDLVNKSLVSAPLEEVQKLFGTLEKIGPQGQEMINELKGYVAQKIKDESTKNVQLDINGKPYVSTPKLDSIIKDLDKSGKLDFLFGKKNAEHYRTLNQVTKDIQTIPKDTTNPSGSAAQIGAMLAESGLQFATTGIPAPVLTLGKMGYEKYKTGQKLNQIKDFINYGKENK